MTNLWRCTCGRLVNRFVNDSCPTCSRDLPGAVAGEPTSDVCSTCELERIGGKCLTRWCADRDPSVDELVGGPHELQTDGGSSSRELSIPADLRTDDGERPWLTPADPYEWDDGETTPRWECPDCSLPLILESTCSNCGWFGRDRWDATLEREGYR